MPTCEVCRKSLKQINNAHLSTHGLTVAEYEEMFPESHRYKNNIDTKRCKTIKFEINENGCFNCISRSQRKDGYFVIGRNSKQVLLHRYIYEQCFGFIPDGLVVRHKCDNRSCINPEHLEIGTQEDNLRDMYERKRENHLSGARHGRAKLSEEEVLEIFELTHKGDLSIKKIAEKYNVGTTTVFSIKTGVTWGKLTKRMGRN